MATIYGKIVRFNHNYYLKTEEGKRYKIHSSQGFSDDDFIGLSVTAEIADIDKPKYGDGWCKNGTIKLG